MGEGTEKGGGWWGVGQRERRRRMGEGTEKGGGWLGKGQRERGKMVGEGTENSDLRTFLHKDGDFWHLPILKSVLDDLSANTYMTTSRTLTTIITIMMIMVIY